MNEIKLTQYSHGSGCGCKIAPAVLQQILSQKNNSVKNKKLLKGNESNEDAAVYDLGNGQALISTTDFFTPIVDDALDFGRIAAANSLSDVYAMGGKPIFALAVLGWPVEKLDASIAALVLKGAEEICEQAGIPIAGGHSIDSPEPIFGLCVNGLTEISKIKYNHTAQAGDLIYLTKKIGTGIISATAKRGAVEENDLRQAITQMIQLNSIGEKIGDLKYVHCMTDITGFGLIGHLLEMANGANLSAEINYQNILLLEGVKDYASKFIYPDNTMRNWSAYQNQVEGINGESLLTLCDPQTNGGLMIAVDPEFQNEFEKFLSENGFQGFASPIGKFVSRKDKTIVIS